MLTRAVCRRAQRHGDPCADAHRHLYGAPLVLPLSRSRLIVYTAAAGSRRIGRRVVDKRVQGDSPALRTAPIPRYAPVISQRTGAGNQRMAGSSREPTPVPRDRRVAVKVVSHHQAVHARRCLDPEPWA